MVLKQLAQVGFVFHDEDGFLSRHEDKFLRNIVRRKGLTQEINPVAPLMQCDVNFYNDTHLQHERQRFGEWAEANLNRRYTAFQHTMGFQLRNLESPINPNTVHLSPLRRRRAALPALESTPVCKNPS
jgi:hypothetical protein